MTEKSLPIFLLLTALIVAGCIAIGVWWLAIPIVVLLLPGPFVTPAILAKLASRRSGAQFQKSVRTPRIRFSDDDEQTLSS